MNFLRNAIEQQVFALQHRIENFERALDAADDYSFQTWESVNKMSYNAMLEAIEEARMEYDEHIELLKIIPVDEGQ